MLLLLPEKHKSIWHFVLHPRRVFAGQAVTRLVHADKVISLNRSVVSISIRCHYHYVTSLSSGARWSWVPALSSQPCRPRIGFPDGSPQAWTNGKRIFRVLTNDKREWEASICVRNDQSVNHLSSYMSIGHRYSYFCCFSCQRKSTKVNKSFLLVLSTWYVSHRILSDGRA